MMTLTNGSKMYKQNVTVLVYFYNAMSKLAAFVKLEFRSISV